MKIVSFINRAPVIEKILGHLRLWPTERPGKLPLEIPCEDKVEILSFDDGWGNNEEPGIDLH